MKSNITVHLCVRLTPKTKDAFKEHAVRYKLTTSELLRELVVAFVENRIDIKPDPNREFLYEPRIQDR